VDHARALLVHAASQDCGTGIRSLCAVGRRMWVGLADGHVRVFSAPADDELPEALGSWLAHGGSVVSIAAAGARVFSLAVDGSVKGWSATLPSEADAQNRCASKRALCAALFWFGQRREPSRDHKYLTEP
jgi:hypothetical protein